MPSYIWRQSRVGSDNDTTCLMLIGFRERRQCVLNLLPVGDSMEDFYYAGDFPRFFTNSAPFSRMTL